MVTPRTTPDEIRRAIQDFLELVEKGTGTTEGDEAALPAALDRLALAATAFPDPPFDDRTFPDPPSDDDHQALLARARARFPSLGHYNVVEHVSTHLENTPVMVGWAVDDVADIYRDLRDVAWRWEHGGEADALWHFEFLFRAHWGQHLRWLQHYLHARVHDDP